MDEMYEDTRGLGFGEEVKRRIRLGTYVLTKEHKNAYYERSLDIRERLKAEYARIFAEFDLLLCPTAPDTAPKIGSIADPTVSYQRDLCTVPASLAGIPALTVPFGKDENNLPTGVQLMGKAYSEALLYYVGRLLEVERNGIV